MRILITGGTGTLGNALVKKWYNGCDTLIIYSRDEQKQMKMAKQYPNCKYFIGDVRDKDRLDIACENVDIIIHSAALKDISTGYYNPFEMIKTNIIGTQNVIDCAIKNRVKNVVFISTDKAVEPINLYGCTKQCCEKMIQSANNYKGDRPTKFNFVRYGNVFGSRGSVAEVWANAKKITVRGVDVTRFHLTQEQAVELVEKALFDEIDVIPTDLKAYSLDHLAHAFQKVTKKPIIYDTHYYPHEKKHEKLARNIESLDAELLNKTELEELVRNYIDKTIQS